MDFFTTFFTFTTSVILLLFLYFSLFILKIYSNKSITNREYAPVMGTVVNQIFHYKKLFDYQTELAKKHPTFRLLTPENSRIFTTDTRNVEHILKTNFDHYIKGEYSQETCRELFGEGIFTVNGDKWKKQRKLASYEFSTRVLRDFSCSVFRKHAAKLIRAISLFSVAKEAFDMQDVLLKFTLDSIFKVGFGVELNCLEGSSKENIAFMKAFDDSNALVCWRFVDPFWKLKRFFNIGCEASLKKNIKVLDDFVNNLIKRKRTLLAGQQDCKEKEDILSRFLVESEKDPGEMTDQYLRDIILNFMIAGKDTTAGTLSWFLYMLCKNPLIQEKIAQEVSQVIGCQKNEDNIDDFVENITEATLDQMHYLHAALAETLRLYPAVPVDGRSSEIDDILPDGYRVKKGDNVSYMAYAMGRMSYIWGEDAEEFRPERWLNNGIFQPESPFKFVAFHAGPRICLGKDFAFRQMKIVSIALHFFRFRLADETRIVTYRTMFTLHIDEGLPLLAIPRTA
ncbi:cytochrome P450 704C1 [Ziziphus jujuba]|uniref:Cytochrome P450 704C1 n=1 Tax=Ziziphus jujuba TaxID=326968 RepID=A0A6P4A1Q4_ZIZJJ|nr:cytochrome P450 704C1 [Ziziphus jujuba]